MPRLMQAGLLAAFFLSGAAALTFQTLWFRLAGLVFGNGVWASSVVLASFMGGLALGNAASTRAGRLRRPLVAYGVLELVVAVTGFILVLGLSDLTRILAPLFRLFLDRPFLLNLVRFASAFFLLLIPTTAMGATLPVLVAALSRSRTDFGGVLGRLYGWNTLGAVFGALVTELYLVENLGLEGAGALAALFNVMSALAALAVSRSLAPPHQRDEPVEGQPTGRVTVRVRFLVAGALCGGLLLALEVIWFRFLQLFVTGTTLAFAVMLAVVLLGIGGGGLLAGRWLRQRPDAHNYLPLVALGAAVLVVLGYGGVSVLPDWFGRYPTYASVFGLGAWLMLPVATASGALFILLGQALRQEAKDGAGAAGLLTLANTAGAAAGALLGGLLLLPRLGVEGCLFVLSLGYGLVAALTLESTTIRAPASRAWLGIGAGAFAVTAALFPFDLMSGSFLARGAARFGQDGSAVVVRREGLTETILYMRKAFLGQPVSYRLVTNGFSMSGTGVPAERYMALFVHWPMALRAASKDALLISYGVGVTARALVLYKQLEHIDVVDISRDVLDLAHVPVLPGDVFPLADPRVKVHVEDGRFFLLTTARRYDLITAEPPPPRLAAIVNLYSQEYFDLIRDRLKEGGFVTYWLPVHDLGAPAALSIVKAFCNVFDDCSLWDGSALDWMLVGSRGARGPVREEDFRRLWSDADLGSALALAGLETPERLGARFMEDHAGLRELAQAAEPVADNWPLRLRREPPDQAGHQFFAERMETRGCAERFRRSEYIGRLWPAGLRDASLPFFDELRIFNDYLLLRRHEPGEPRSFIALYEALRGSDSYVLPLEIAGSSPRENAIAEAAAAGGADHSVVDFTRGLGFLARRQYREADERFRAVEAKEPGFQRLQDFRTLAWCLGGSGRTPLGGPPPKRLRPHPVARERSFWEALERACGLAPPMREQ